MRELGVNEIIGLYDHKGYLVFESDSSVDIGKFANCRTDAAARALKHNWLLAHTYRLVRTNKGELVDRLKPVKRILKHEGINGSRMSIVCTKRDRLTNKLIDAYLSVVEASESSKIPQSTIKYCMDNTGDTRAVATWSKVSRITPAIRDVLEEKYGSEVFDRLYLV